MINNTLIICSGLLVSLIIWSSVPSFAQDWPQWRGPNRDGLLRDAGIPGNWPDSLRLIWQTPVGAGRSSPVVADGRIFVHTRQGEEVVSCLNLSDGKLIWKQKNLAPFTKNQYAQSQGEGPFSTPTVQDGRLYTLGINGLLSCFDAASGELKWRHAFKKEVDTSKLFCGAAMSPLLVDGLCIVHVGDDMEGALVAHDAVSGAVEWTWNEQGPGYASPIAIEVAGVKQLVTLTDEACIGVDIQTGGLLWQLPFEDEWHENIVTPVFHNGLLILSGVRKGTLAVNISPKSGGWIAETLWHDPDTPMYMSSPVLSGDFLYGLSKKKKGQFFCMNPTTGEVLWTSEGRAGSNASILSDGVWLFMLTTEAQFIVAEATSQAFAPVKQYTVAESPTWGQPVLLDNRLLVKDETSLLLWSLAAEAVN